MKTGEMIKYYRKQKGMSAEQLAAIVEVSPSTIYRYENDDISNMGIDKLKLIADALGTNAHTLLGWVEDPSVSDCVIAGPESQLLELNASLNEEGQEELLKYARLLAASEQYKKHCESELVEA